MNEKIEEMVKTLMLYYSWMFPGIDANDTEQISTDLEFILEAAKIILNAVASAGGLNIHDQSELWHAISTIDSVLNRNLTQLSEYK